MADKVIRCPNCHHVMQPDWRGPDAVEISRLKAEVDRLKGLPPPLLEQLAKAAAAAVESDPLAAAMQEIAKVKGELEKLTAAATFRVDRGHDDNCIENPCSCGYTALAAALGEVKG